MSFNTSQLYYNPVRHTIEWSPSSDADVLLSQAQVTSLPPNILDAIKQNGGTSAPADFSMNAPVHGSGLVTQPPTYNYSPTTSYTPTPTSTSNTSNNPYGLGPNTVGPNGISTDSQGYVINPQKGEPKNPGTTGSTTTAGNTNSGNSTSGASTGSSGNTNTSTSSATPMSYNPAWSNFGMTPEIWNSLNPTQQAVYSVAHSTGVALQNNNASDVTVSSALAAAATDPNLVAKYSDALKLDTKAFSQTIQQLAEATSTQSQQQQKQFESERKDLAEKSAAAGTAYSGFRKQAEQDLATSEGNIVSSSRSQLKKGLQDATNAFETKYGSGATSPASTNFLDPFAMSKVGISGLATAPSPEQSTYLTGTLAGGITGSAPIQKAADTQTLAANYVTLGQKNPVVSAA